MENPDFQPTFRRLHESLPPALIPVLILAAGFVAWKWLGTPIEPPKPRQHTPQRLKTEKIVLNRTFYEIVIGKNGLTPGDWLATSRLPYAPDKAPVQIIDPPPADEAVGPTGETRRARTSIRGW